MKKAFLLITVFFHLAYCSRSQCNIKEATRDDGTRVKYINPIPVGHDNDIVAALGLETNGNDYFVTLWIVYQYESKQATGMLVLNFEDNFCARLPIYLSQRTILKGMNATISTYKIKAPVSAQIKTHRLKSIGFQETDDTLRVVPAEQNQGILIDDYNCLTK